MFVALFGASASDYPYSSCFDSSSSCFSHYSFSSFWSFLLVLVAIIILPPLVFLLFKHFCSSSDYWLCVYLCGFAGFFSGSPLSLGGGLGIGTGGANIFSAFYHIRGARVKTRNTPQEEGFFLLGRLQNVHLRGQKKGFFLVRRPRKRYRNRGFRRKQLGHQSDPPLFTLLLF